MPKPTQKYITLNPDEFFERQAETKIVTSDNTLEKLPQIEHEEITQLLSQVKLTHRHKYSYDQLLVTIEKNFNKWHKLLLHGFNLVLYGLGSKKTVLETFRKKRLNDSPVIVINGFFPGLIFKEILDAFGEILNVAINSANSFESLDVIEREMNAYDDFHVFLLVNNIEGDVLRGKNQSLLGKLAAIKNVHLIATVDHINAGLLWENATYNNYNFLWYDATTYLPYVEETSFEKTASKQDAAMTLTSLLNIFQSLPQNAHLVYKMVIKLHQNAAKDNYQGVPFQQLYKECRKEFITSSEAALRAILTEFFDHKLLKSKKNIEGIEYLTIPVKDSILTEFLAD